MDNSLIDPISNQILVWSKFYVKISQKTVLNPVPTVQKSVVRNETGLSLYTECTLPSFQLLVKFQILESGIIPFIHFSLASLVLTALSGELISKTFCYIDGERRILYTVILTAHGYLIDPSYERCEGREHHVSKSRV